MIDGVYEAEDVRFHEAVELSEAAIARVQERVRRRVLKAFVRWGLLEPEVRDEMLEWRHGGGFSLDAAVRLEADDREGLERLLRYCARPPLAAGHLQWRDERHERLIYRLPKPGADGSPELVLTGLELLERLLARHVARREGRLERELLALEGLALLLPLGAERVHLALAALLEHGDAALRLEADLLHALGVLVLLELRRELPRVPQVREG